MGGYKSKLPQHECTEKCVCPTHKTYMYYWWGNGLHACTDLTCEFADGVNLDDLRCTFTWDEPDYPTGWTRVTCTQLQNYHGSYHMSDVGHIYPVAEGNDRC